MKTIDMSVDRSLGIILGLFRYRWLGVEVSSFLEIPRFYINDKIIDFENVWFSSHFYCPSSFSYFLSKRKLWVKMFFLDYGGRVFCGVEKKRNQK